MGSQKNFKKKTSILKVGFWPIFVKSSYSCMQKCNPTTICIQLRLGEKKEKQMDSKLREPWNGPTMEWPTLLGLSTK
jgi:hypothetical protein